MMRVLLLALLAASAAADCSHYDDCLSCASAHGWDGQCRWCPRADDGGSSHCHDPGSLYDKCSKSELIMDPMSCPSSPGPAPRPVPPVESNTVDPTALLSKLFTALGVQADAAACVKDAGNAGADLRNFASAVGAKNATIAARYLASALTALSTASNDCAVTQVQAKLDALAARLHMANVTKAFDGDVKVYIDASEIWDDLTAVAKAVKAKDAASAASALAKLESDWTTVTGGCAGSASDDSACNLVDGLLRILGLVSADLSDSCKTDLVAAFTDLEAAGADFRGKNYTGAVALTAAGLDQIAQAIGSDACNLKGVEAVMAKVAPKLTAAVVNETSGAVKIVVGSAEVYDELYQAFEALERKDYVTFGEQCGLLLQKLRASDCKSKACDVLEGLLAALQLEGGDYAQCVSKIDATYGDFDSAVTAAKDKEWVDAVKDLGEGLAGLSASVQACGVTDLAAIVEKVATQLGAGVVARDIGTATQVLVNGTDIAATLGQAMQDWADGNHRSFGADLGQLAQEVTATGCTTTVCKLVEGLLQQFGLFFQDLDQCEADLTAAEANFTAGAAKWQSKDYKDAVEEYAAGLNVVAHAVTDCGVAPQLTTLANEANVLGIAKVAAGIGSAASVIVHGADFYEELYATLEGFEHHDYRAAGQSLGHVLDTLSQWTAGHSCTSDMCYLVMGVMEFMGDIQGDIRACELDFHEMWGNVSAAYHDFTDEHGIVWEFSHDIPKVKKAVGEVGVAFKVMADAVNKCHVEQLAQVLEAVAVKLSVAPEVQLVEEALKILVEGVQIEQEVGDACIDYSKSDWVGFGYNIAKLLKTLL